MKGHNGPEKINPSKEGFGTFHLGEIQAGRSIGVHKCAQVHIFKRCYYPYLRFPGKSHQNITKETDSIFLLELKNMI